VDPTNFIAKVESLYNNRTEVDTDEVELKDGRILYRHTYPVENYGKYLGRVWYFLDVTPLKQAQLKIEKQQIFQKAIIENVQDGIIACNSQGKINLMNFAGREFYSCTTQDPIGIDIGELTHFANDGVTPLRGERNPLQRALNGETITNEEIIVKNENKKQHILRVNGQSMLHDSTENIGAVLSLHDITDINEAKEQLQFMAYHDALTGLPNRRLFHDLLLQSLKQATRNKQKVGVLFLDMDNFKSVNDNHGHDVGDTLLTEVGKTLQSCLRESDLLCRWGGDEFVIGLPENHGGNEILKVAEKICATVLNSIHAKNDTFNISVTIGIAISPDHGNDPDILIRNADAAMYHAKKLGKNRCELFSREPMSAA
jgi:diguanylate cyclase (GGDEF)-like protein/PAS domain S-box-containing protein